MRQESIRSLAQVLERQVSALSDVQQGVLTVSIIEHPQHRHLPRAGVLLAASDPIQATFAQLRLAFRQQVTIAGITVKRGQDSGAERK
jgi:hypothetical protein